MFGQRRKKFIEEHKPVPDHDFIKMINPEPEIIPYIIALRHSVAEICKIPYETIHFDENPETLVSLCAEWDDTDVVLKMEDLLNKEIEDLPQAMGWRIFFWGKKGPTTFAEWTLNVGRSIQAQQPTRRLNQEDAPGRNTAGDLPHRWAAIGRSRLWIR